MTRMGQLAPRPPGVQDAAAADEVANREATAT